MLKPGLIKKVTLLIVMLLVVVLGLGWQRQEKLKETTKAAIFKVQGHLKGRPTFVLDPIVLDDGKILIIDKRQAALQVYDPTSGNAEIIAKAGALSSSLTSAAKLDKNRILLIGEGQYSKIYDLDKNTFHNTGKMVSAGSYSGSALTLLSNGKVLIFGGNDANETSSNIQIFDPKTEQYSKIGELAESRFNAKILKLKNDYFLIVGGRGLSGMPKTIELYRPFEKKTMTVGRLSKIIYVNTAVMLDDSQILITGFTDLDDKDHNNRRLAEIFNLKNHLTTVLQHGPVCERVEASMVNISDSKFMIFGIVPAGADFGVGCNSLKVEVFNPSTDSFKIIGSSNPLSGSHSLFRVGSQVYLFGANAVQVYEIGRE